MRKIQFTLAVWSFFTIQLPAQTPLLNNTQALALYTRSLQVVESTMVAVPDLARAGAPLLENARQSLTNLRVMPGNAALQYNLILNIRAYLTLSDAVPKPVPFPDEGQRQFTELRNSLTQMEAHFRVLIEQKDRQLRNPDPDNLGRFLELDSRLGPPQPARPRIVFLGDSITDFWRLNEYFPDRDFINRGISGQITSQMLGRMKTDVIDLHPVSVVLLGGINDVARGTSVANIESNITLIADLCDYHKIKLILATVLPVSSYHKDANPAYDVVSQRPPEQIRALNKWMQAFCVQRNYVFLDYYSETVDASGQMKADLADDGLHPNSTGYRIMAPLALAAINKTLVTAIPANAPQQTPRKRRLFMK